jgi:DNA-directed RNA polymerase specialized sigma subunit
METEFLIQKNDYGYFVCSQNNITDSCIAEELEVDVDKYFQTLINDYNAFVSSDEDLYFKNKKDAKKALDWVEALYLGQNLN